MRFRGTNVAIVDKDEPLSRDGVKGLLMAKAAPLTFRKPKPIMQIALERAQDNSLLAVMLHAKHRVSRDPKKQEQFQAAFIQAILEQKYDALETILEEPSRTALLDIVKSPQALNLSKAVRTAKDGKAVVEAVALEHEVTAYDIQYILAYLSKSTPK